MPCKSRNWVFSLERPSLFSIDRAINKAEEGSCVHHNRARTREQRQVNIMGDEHHRRISTTVAHRDWISRQQEILAHEPRAEEHDEDLQGRAGALRVQRVADPVRIVQANATGSSNLARRRDSRTVWQGRDHVAREKLHGARNSNCLRTFAEIYGNVK